jgi:hypothetical protein
MRAEADSWAVAEQYFSIESLMARSALAGSMAPLSTKCTLILSLARDLNFEVINALALFFQNQNNVNGRAAAQAHQEQLHRASTSVVPANIRGTINMNRYTRQARGFKVKIIIYSVEFYFHVLQEYNTRKQIQFLNP